VSLTSQNRRQVLSGLMKLLVVIGFIFLSIPFISTFSSNDIDEKQATSSRWVVTVPISELIDGTIKKLSWSGGQVWIYVRNKNDIQSLKKKTKLLKDFLSIKSEQPENMKNNFRSVNEKYFVFIPQENKKKCQVSLTNSGEDFKFTEPCFGARYDAAGRIFKNSGHKDQHNLIVPEHIIENGVLKVGIWTPKI
jgi:Rieske Fe-S protein